MKTDWKEALYFTRTQRLGILILGCLMILSYLFTQLYLSYRPTTETNFEKIEQEIAEFEAALEEQEKKEYDYTSSKRTRKEPTIPVKIELFPFNPNEVTKEQLLQLGLSPKVATTFINYQKSGGRFFKKEDIQKIYGLTTSDYQRLAPYIRIPKRIKTTPPKPKKKPISSTQSVVLTPFPFNPNTISKDSLLQLGLPEKIAQTVVNYRSKGGRFYKKQDFSRIYGVTEEAYETLEPYIEIPDNAPLATSEKIEEPKESLTVPTEYEGIENVKVDVNTATIEDWKKLPGIGNMRASKIVNFRNHLGGFSSLNQIKTTYGVPDSVIENVRSQLLLSPIPRKINLNTITAEELAKHPYVTNKEAYTIVNFRTNHGQFSSLEDVKRIRSFNDQWFFKMGPYLTFE